MALRKFTPIPAIDLMNGQVVRLKRGEAGLKTVYSDDPVSVAMKFENAGATRLHVVDLDGAFEGRPRNWEALSHLRLAVKMKIEVGGGLRDEEDVQKLFDTGVDYAILGTTALQDVDLVKRLVETHGEKIIVGVDSRDGKVATKGWVETSETTTLEFASALESAGVDSIIFTDIATDGMMEGPNLDQLSELANGTAMKIIASGGVRNLDDLLAIHGLGHENVIGSIIGRAIYDGELDVKDAMTAFEEI